MSGLSNGGGQTGTYGSNNDLGGLSQPTHIGSNSSTSSLSLSSQASLHTHSNTHTTTNICLYPPPNPLAKPILPATTGLSKIVPISNNTVSTSQPGHGGRSWTHKSSTAGNLGSVNERTVPSYQVRDNIRTGISFYFCQKDNNSMICSIILVQKMLVCFLFLQKLFPCRDKGNQDFTQNI